MSIDEIFLNNSEQYKGEFETLKKKHTQQDRVNICSNIVKKILLQCPIHIIDGEYHFFDDDTYVPISEKELSITIYNWLCEIGIGALDAKRVPDLVIPILQKKRRETDNGLIAFSNGIYDIENDCIYDFSDSFAATYKVPYQYNAKAECPLWENFLSEVLPNDADRRILQEFVGFCYINRNNISIEKALLVYGNGANGKSVVFDVITALIGKEYVCELSPAQLNDDKQIITLRNKRLNFAPDVKANSAFTSALKALISGQTVLGWDLYKGNVPIVAPPLIFAFNEMPDFLDKSHGFFRRLIPLYFGVTIPPEKQDKRLSIALIQEMSGIFNWAMVGRQRLLSQNGEFTQSINSEKELNKIKILASPVLNYMEANGFYPQPLYPNQAPREIAAKTIMDALNLNGKQVCYELTRAGYRNVKRGVSYYQIYTNNSIKNS
jgi:putative DNA primase/helicase|nr:MAG TPA: dsDNA helicase [Caudoviricetes sp.]